MRVRAFAAMLLAAASLAGSAGAQTDSLRMTRRSFASVRGSRDFLMFRPANLPAKGENRSLVVMLHGCTQSADDFARGTRMNEFATKMGFMVIYPEQTVAAHPQKCWNWYVPEQSTRERGEAALLAALIDSVAFAEGVSAEHVSLVGMSAGAAMAGDLGVAYPERFAALALHSGIPALAATDQMSALAAMRSGSGDGDALGTAALAAMGSRARAIPVIVLQGADDRVVSPKNLAATVRQWTVVNEKGPVAKPVDSQLIMGVGHAWSGGSADGTYTAPNGPDATALIVEFLRRVGAITHS